VRWLASIAAETLTAQLAVYNHFASSNEKCRSGLTERHYRKLRAFLFAAPCVQAFGSVPCGVR
ncbi:hypothetical protein, partial [Ralstonia pseudosolanacearum]|uniref:hypothetical protein n=1 Tax=Ralstonia pseudosolanacearum TaxID=1310165 RepID=UPI001C82B9CE